MLHLTWIEMVELTMDVFIFSLIWKIYKRDRPQYCSTSESCGHQSIIISYHISYPQNQIQTNLCVCVFSAKIDWFNIKCIVNSILCIWLDWNQFVANLVIRNNWNDTEKVSMAPAQLRMRRTNRECTALVLNMC